MAKAGKTRPATPSFRGSRVVWAHRQGQGLSRRALAPRQRPGRDRRKMGLRNEGLHQVGMPGCVTRSDNRLLAGVHGAGRCACRARYGIVAAELGVTAMQLKTWKLELDAAGSAAAIAAQRGEAAELSQLRRDNKRLKEEVAVLRKAISAFFASGRRNHEGQARLHRRPCSRTRRSPSLRVLASLGAGITPGSAGVLNEPSALPGVRSWSGRSERFSRRASAAMGRRGSGPSCATEAAVSRRGRSLRAQSETPFRAPLTAPHSLPTAHSGYNKGGWDGGAGR